MKADVAGRAQTILDCVAFVEERSPKPCGNITKSWLPGCTSCWAM